ncbi:MAG: hypothetical protein JO264_15445, partial [Acidisphaera sp.]|nr:hypothetical protein [Acidisphaera sp.]
MVLNAKPDARAQTAEAMRRLADWAAGPEARRAAAPVRRRAAVILADDLGAMV